MYKWLKVYICICKKSCGFLIKNNLFKEMINLSEKIYLDSSCEMLINCKWIVFILLVFNLFFCICGFVFFLVLFVC